MDVIARFHALLQTPDPLDLIGRGSHVTVPGLPIEQRRQTAGQRIVMAWLQHRHVAVDPYEVPAPAKTLARGWWRKRA